MSALNEQGLPPNYPFQPDWEVSPRQVKAMREGGKAFTLIDCRTPGEYQVARIEGATLVPIQEAAARLPELEEHRDSKIVVFCHHGGRALRMTAFLRQQGFSDVKSMAGGIDLWAQDIEPGMRRY